MSDSKHTNQENRVASLRVFLAFLLPIAAALVSGIVAGSLSNVETVSAEGATAVLLTGVGIISLLLGLRWYGQAGMGLRGGRPLFASIGFSVMGWVIFLILRILVEIQGFGPENSSRSFIYLLLFEALAVQLWTYGLLFHAVADWRGPLTAAIVGGIVFGMTGALLFQESFIDTTLSIAYFVVWGIMYGIIRLRTGSLLGTTLVQALQSFSAWVVVVPLAVVNPTELQNLYIAAIIAYSIIIWRLWPKEASDYRV